MLGFDNHPSIIQKKRTVPFTYVLCSKCKIPVSVSELSSPGIRPLSSQPYLARLFQSRMYILLFIPIHAKCNHSMGYQFQLVVQGCPRLTSYCRWSE